MNVTNLEAVTFGVADMASCRRFWQDFGLLETSVAGGAAFACQNGASVVLRDLEDGALPPAIEPGATLRESTFGVRTARDLDEIAAELAKDRDVRRDPDGTLHAIDPLGFAIAFRVARVKPVAAPELKFNTPGHPDRISTRGQFVKEVRPLEMTHAVFMIDDADKIVPFYVERLGFIVSDCYPG